MSMTAHYCSFMDIPQARSGYILNCRYYLDLEKFGEILLIIHDENSPILYHCFPEFAGEGNQYLWTAQFTTESVKFKIWWLLCRQELWGLKHWHENWKKNQPKHLLAFPTKTEAVGLAHNFTYKTSLHRHS